MHLAGGFLATVMAAGSQMVDIIELEAVIAEADEAGITEAGIT